MKVPSALASEELLAVFAEAQEILRKRKKDASGKKARPRRSKRAPVSLTDQELLKVLALARKRLLRDHVMLLITYRHGLRVSEALSIRRCDLGGERLTIVRGKGSEPVDQPLLGHENPLLNEIEAVATWLGEMGERGKKGAAKLGGRRSRAKILQSSKNVKFRAVGASSIEALEASALEALFPLTRQRFFQIYRRYAIEAGLPARKRHPHVLKHSIAKHLIKAGVPINEVQDWLGWKSLRTADHYTRPDADEVAESVDRVIRNKRAFHPATQGMLFGER
jgi:site-specific recombinase XerD